MEKLHLAMLLVQTFLLYLCLMRISFPFPRKCYNLYFTPDYDFFPPAAMPQNKFENKRQYYYFRLTLQTLENQWESLSSCNPLKNMLFPSLKGSIHCISLMKWQAIESKWLTTAKKKKKKNPASLTPKASQHLSIIKIMRGRWSKFQSTNPHRTCSVAATIKNYNSRHVNILSWKGFPFRFFFQLLLILFWNEFLSILPTTVVKLKQRRGGNDTRWIIQPAWKDLRPCN